MTQGEVKTRLLAANIAYKRYAAARDKAGAYRMQLTGRAVRTDSEGNASKNNSTEAGYIRLAELDEAVDTAKLEWLAARTEVEQSIALCPAEIWTQVLTYRYLNFCRFEDIAKALGYSDPHIYRIHKKALKYLAEELKEDSK